MQGQETKSGSDLSSGQFRFLVILVSHFDMVAEQVRKTIIWRRRLVTSETDTSEMAITSSSGKQRRFKWTLHQRRSRSQYVRSWSSPQSRNISTDVIRWSQVVIHGMVRRSHCILSNHWLSRVHTVVHSGSILKGRHSRRCHVHWLSLRHHRRDQERKMTIRSKRRQIEQSSNWRQASRSSGSHQKRFKTLWQSSTLSQENSSRRYQLYSRRISFCDTLCFMRLQGIQTSWSEESCERQTRHWTGDLASTDHLFRRISKNQDGIIAQADHVTGRVACWEVKGCHWAALSLARAHLKVWINQQRKDLRHSQDHNGTPKCQRQCCSVSDFQCQWEHYMVSSS